ncbi:kinase-like domain-containing protein, partial [Gigaspora rosea]
MYDEMIEWIPFNRLSNIKKIGKGGFGTVFSATWLDGIRTTVKDSKKEEYTKSRETSSTVALKTLSNSQDLSSSDFLQQFKNHMRCKLECGELDIYGLTQCTENQEHLKDGDYLMVFEFADYGDLSSYLQKNFKKLMWEHKLLRLIEISCDLAKVHKTGYIHRDFHSGNILLSKIGVMKADVISYISDLGLSEKFGEYLSKGEVVGVLPYVAPEILSDEYKIHTPEVDIYGLGVIMVEMSTGKKPFDGDKYDTKLAVKICKGLRPECSPGTPDCYIELANKCMQKDPQKRPTANMNTFRMLKKLI